MTSPDQPSRIDELKARWEADPSSRVFVQLAEEYRRQGRIDDAVAVLEKGLADQPNYVSALAALGRCRLDGGDASGAVEVLSRVTEQDPSHPLAAKLLVEAHLQIGDLDQAAERLELYRMMADSDPEIEELERRLSEAREQEPAGDSSVASAAAVHQENAGSADALSDLQDLELSFEDSEETEKIAEAPTGSAQGADDIFDLGSTEAPLPQEGPFELSDPTTAPLPSPPEDSGTPQAGADEPFGSLLAETDLQRLSEDLVGEGIFAFGGGAEATSEPRVEDLSREPVAEVEGEDQEVGEPTGEDAEEATVTLGRLYMAQGHRAEAARIFRSILQRDPDNEISRKALAELEGGEVEESEAVKAWDRTEERERARERQGVTERKIAMLEEYLQRLRRARRATGS